MRTFKAAFSASILQNWRSKATSRPTDARGTTKNGTNISMRAESRMVEV
jgi:hypothetical protein